jgi:hypothetical protein
VWQSKAFKPRGQNDLMMAAHLPFSDRFVTDEWPQEKSLREIAEEARISSDVLSYQDFSGIFSIVPGKTHRGKLRFEVRFVRTKTPSTSPQIR